MGKVSIKKETEMITNYTPSKDTEEHVGFIYMRSIIINGVKFIYIGESSNMLDRNYHWRCLKVEYGGKRIEKARKEHDPSNWMWDVLERVDANSADELEKLLKEKEAKYIIQYKSYEKGFNSKWGLSEYLNEKAA